MVETSERFTRTRDGLLELRDARRTRNFGMLAFARCVRKCQCRELIIPISMDFVVPVFPGDFRLRPICVISAARLSDFLIIPIPVCLVSWICEVCRFVVFADLRISNLRRLSDLCFSGFPFCRNSFFSGFLFFWISVFQDFGFWGE